MADVKVTCVCGAIYEVIKTVGPSRETRPFKCVLCDRELFAWDGDKLGQLHLVWRLTRTEERLTNLKTAKALGINSPTR